MFDPFDPRSDAPAWAELTRRAGVPEVEPAWVVTHRESVRVIDIREPYELREAHVAGIENVPLGRIPVEAPAWDPAAPLVLLCRSGNRSASAALYLERLGFRKVASVRGGILAWAAEGLPLP